MSLAGMRVLIVEDEPLLSLDLEEIIKELGGVVAASARNLETALAASREVSCDVAVLDLNLAGKRADAVAEQLVARNIPVVFATGYGDQGIDGRFKGRPLIEKPYDSGTLERALKAVHQV